MEMLHHDHHFCMSEFETTFPAVFGTKTSIQRSPTIYGCHAATGQPKALKGFETKFAADDAALETVLVILLYALVTLFRLFETKLTADWIASRIPLMIDRIEFTAP